MITHEQFNKVCYDTLRELHNVTDKVNIMSVILYARDDSDKYCKVLYGDGHIDIINELKRNGIDLHIDFEHPNVKSAYEKTIAVLREKDDEDGFYKALYECDEYAVAIYDICRAMRGKKNFNEIRNSLK